MARLIYYHKEKVEWFPEAYNKELNIEKAEIVFRKLCKHFKLDGYGRQVNLSWSSGNRHPQAFGTSAIQLNSDWNNFGVLCHEIAHIREKKRYGDTGHTKRHRRIMKIIINYCKRKNWFEEELNRRLAPKPIKAEPSKQELEQQKIAKIEMKVKRYTSKVKMYEKKLVRTKKKLIRLQKRGAISSIQIQK
jgi:hypothetical protein